MGRWREIERADFAVSFRLKVGSVTAMVRSGPKPCLDSVPALLTRCNIICCVKGLCTPHLEKLWGSLVLRYTVGTPRPRILEHRRPGHHLKRQRCRRPPRGPPLYTFSTARNRLLLKRVSEGTRLPRPGSPGVSSLEHPNQTLHFADFPCLLGP